MSTTTTITATEYIPRGPVEAEFLFYAPPADNSAPYNYVQSPPPGVPQRNYQQVPHKVTVDDIRGHEAEYTLDGDAFQVLQNVATATSYATFDDDEAVQRIYYPEVEKLLLDNVPGSHKIVIFDHTIRRQGRNAPRQPVNQAHVDQTDKASFDRVKLHVPDAAEAEKLLAGRYRIINVWRPLNGTVVSLPLGFAAASSVDAEEDLVPVQHRYPNRTGETMGVKYNAAQRWKYLSGMETEERLLLKCADSKEGVGKRVPHSAFADPRTPEGARPRESIEVRALVFG
ncbi:hypothetical protein ASPWEDRAFT_107774 [Aspergillus wentii DTO 134E9]|uniref:Methyltransferase n=1 Tax=Aspergillus wentii DTO 134E9 TaxID=1073089 RepID=A0A1L9RNP5_ASPWE|nr:uncharacterized protein ASPWEDRAFT_107774 [Aspergillus wentii DTO 134E9]KAI9934293.1 hypothetical protein MW887_005367 [Aspergillus wentii]OJJ36570.1 hypothetical protein ASPWEDRAFT_107774 [Aspergillus wentii DTO 134E9]